MHINMFSKRGVSPVIATILLIAIVVVLAGIVFLWARGFITEGIQKSNEPIERSCERVKFKAEVIREGSDYFLEVNNQENIPIYGFDIKVLGEGTTRVHTILDSPIDVGSSARTTLSTNDIPEIQQGVDLLIVPILLGKQGDTYMPSTCPDERGIGTTVI